MNPSPDPTPAIAYGLYTAEPIRAPGGALIMPDLPPEARTRQARLERLKESSSWAEIILLDWFKRLAVFGVSAGFDIDRFERATQSLWRLTAVAKSIFALEDNPNRPIPAELQSEVDSIMDHTLGARASTPAEATSNQPVSAPSLGPRTASSATPLPASIPAPASTDPLLSSAGILPASPSSSSSPPPSSSPLSSSPHSALSAPHLPAPSVRAVPSCPTLSLDGAATYLTRTEADLAEATRSKSSAGSPLGAWASMPAEATSNQPVSAPSLGPRTASSATPLPDTIPVSPSRASHPSLTSHSSHLSHSSIPNSAFPIPHSQNPQSQEDPYASCGGACLECDKPFCALRHMAPLLAPSSPLQCDGTCRDCASLHTCPYPPASLRPG